MGKRGSKKSLDRKIDRVALAERRRKAIALYRKDWTQYRIAKHLGVSFEAMSNWVEVYKHHGLKALESLGKPGPKPGSSKKQKSKTKRENTKQWKIASKEKDRKSSPNVFGRIFKLIGNR